MGGVRYTRFPPPPSPLPYAYRPLILHVMLFCAEKVFFIPFSNENVFSYSRNASGFSTCPRLILANTPVANIQKHTHHYKKALYAAYDGGIV